MDQNNLSLIPLIRTSSTNPNTLQLFPLGTKSQRVIVGSQDGVLQCVSLKKGVAHVCIVQSIQETWRNNLGHFHDLKNFIQRNRFNLCLL